MRSLDPYGAGRGVRGILFMAILGSVVLVPGSAVLADLYNGDFSSGLDGWDSSGDVVVNSGGVAVLGEDSQGLPYLEQVFTLPAGSISLSFDYKYIPPSVGDIGESFSASLLDLDFNPLIPTYDLYPPDDTPDSFYFMHDSAAGALWNSPLVNVTPYDEGWSTVVLDVTGLGSSEALIAFDFVGLGGDGTVLLDNVSVAVPAPPAVVLFVLGIGTACTMLRGRMARTT